MIASRLQDLIESHNSRIAIVQLFNYCDYLEISCKLQNKVVYAAMQDVTFYELTIKN